MTLSSPQSTCRSTGASSAPTARAVPQLMCNGMDHLRASVSAPPMWSACSCVIRMASIWSARTSRRARRRSTSFAEKPQSSSTRVVVVPLTDSTSNALPSLPLPRLAKRIGENLVQLGMQQRDDPLRVSRCIYLAVGVDHGDLGDGVRLRTHVDHELA